MKNLIFVLPRDRRKHSTHVQINLLYICETLRVDYFLHSRPAVMFAVSRHRIPSTYDEF